MAAESADRDILPRMAPDDAPDADDRRPEEPGTPLLTPATRHRWVGIAIVVIGAALAFWRCG